MISINAGGGDRLYGIITSGWGAGAMGRSLLDHALARGCAATLAIGLGAPVWAHGVTERVSLGPSGRQSNGYSFVGAISADGRFVAFESDANNLVPGDTNECNDVFVRDRLKGRTERVSLGPAGVQGNDGSYRAAISADGRFVAFESWASNLVPGETNGTQGVFVRDRLTGRTERVSLGAGAIPADDVSSVGGISADGRFVTFVSWATNLVPGDANGASDVFVRDRKKGTTRRISLGPGGVQGNAYSTGPTISADGRFVAFRSQASNLVSGDTNAIDDVFVRDRRNGTTRLISLGPGGLQGNRESGSGGTSISADGRFVAFWSMATNLVPGDTNATNDVFVRDRQKSSTRRVNLGPHGVQSNEESGSDGVSISADGRFVAFESDGNNLVPGDTNRSRDVFVRDRLKGTTRRISRSSDGDQGNEFSFDPVLSADGQFAGFSSIASNLVPNDTNNRTDVFVRSLVH